MPVTFTNPKTWTSGRVSREEMNTYLRDNLKALKYPPTAVYTTVAHANDYTTTSTTFTDVDGTNFALTITTTGDGAGGNGDVLIWFSGAIYSSTSIRIAFRILEDGVALNANTGLMLSEASGMRAFGFLFLRANAPPGTHTYKLQWQVSSGTGELAANAGTSGRNCKAQFGVREMS